MFFPTLFSFFFSFSHYFSVDRQLTRHYNSIPCVSCHTHSKRNILFIKIHREKSEQASARTTNTVAVATAATRHIEIYQFSCRLELIQLSTGVINTIHITPHQLSIGERYCVRSAFALLPHTHSVPSFYCLHGVCSCRRAHSRFANFP